MRPPRNPGRVAGLWYLLLVVLGPVRLMYIPSRLFVDDPDATVRNIAMHQVLFRFGIAADLAAAVTLILLVMAFYRLFETVDRHLAVLVILFGGVMPSLLYFVNAATDLLVVTMAHGTGFLTAFDTPQQHALAMMFLRLHACLVTAAETLWGMWLLPLALLVYRSGFMPRFLGIWLSLNGVVYVTLSMIGVLAPHVAPRAFTLAQPALFGEMVFMLWLVFRGARPLTAPTPA